MTEAHSEKSERSRRVYSLFFRETRESTFIQILYMHN